MNTQVYEEAGEWVVRHRSGGLDVAERVRFDTWLRRSPEHIRAYLEMSAIWEDLPTLDRDRTPTADELVESLRTSDNVVPLEHTLPLATPEPAPSRPTGPTTKSMRPAWLGRRALTRSLAASLLVAVGVTGWLTLQRGVYSTDIGERRAVTLSDGSSVELNARSKIRVRYTDRTRAIDLLEGQVLFRVAKNVERPFVVASDGARVRAVGTQFDVYRKSSGTVVTVIEGRVAVLSAEPDDRVTGSGGARANARELPATYLSAGEQLVIAPAVLGIPKPANVEAATAWTQQRLVFDFAPLTDVAEEFNRYNHRPLVIEDASLRDFHVSGSFSSTDPKLLLRFLRAQRGIAVRETDDAIHISRQASPAD